MRIMTVISILLAGFVTVAVGKTDVRLAATPALSSDGKILVFEWNNDLWKVSIAGGQAEQLTTHPSRDCWPQFSPDGTEIAFMSKRDDAWQLYIVPSSGGTVKQLTYNTQGCNLCDWYPDGKSLIIQADRDHSGWSCDAARIFKVSRTDRKEPELLCDATGKYGKISPDGTKLLFVREGVELYRKGYKGTFAAQIWLYDFEKKTFELICDDIGGNRTPLWKPDGKGFYFLCAESGTFNIWECDIKSRKKKQLTFFEDDSVILPGISRDGKTMVFRHLFDFYRFNPTLKEQPVRIDIWTDADNMPSQTRRRWYPKAWNGDETGSVDFTDDGLEITFTCGGDLWVMDTVLRDPVQVTSGTLAHDQEALFAKDRQSIIFLRDIGHKVDIWKAEKNDPAQYWWENRSFKLTQLTRGGECKSLLGLSPDGKLMAYNKGRGKLCVSKLDGSGERILVESPYAVYYDWSPDSKWMVCTISDSDSNADVFILSVDGSSKPYNVSRHPNWDGSAVWSPDGKIIAYIGKRYDNECDIFYVYLRREDEDRNKLDRDLDEARKVLDASRGEAGTESVKNEDEQKDVVIDFSGLENRIHRISIPNAVPNWLFWSYDSTALAFWSTINGKKGTYKVVFPDNLVPYFMTDKIGSGSKWTKQGILWSVDGVPHAYTKPYSFKVHHEINIPEYRRLAFRMIWRQMRDNFYDSNLNNLDWDAIRLKYEDQAAAAINHSAFNRVVAMLLGELNASHTGFMDTDVSIKEWSREWSSGQWLKRTSHLGLKFDPEYSGPGLKVKHVIRGGPTDTVKNKVLSGEILLSIDGIAVTQGYDISEILTGKFPRCIELKIKGVDGQERVLTVAEQSYEEIRELVKEEEEEHCRQMVSDLSKGTLGYLNIERMNWANLREFERDVFAEGDGKDGLVIDVRYNVGGFVADRLLSILCRAEHAITIPRDGEISYPSGYYGYAVWNKPIVVLCNQNSASNAEIFSHAIKTLKRGKLVGVQTQGAVIVTPRKNILDLGELYVPDRGFFTLDGKDMEMNGAIPDYIVWPHPDDASKGIDRQIDKAVEVLLEDVKEFKARKQPKLIKASETRK